MRHEEYDDQDHWSEDERYEYEDYHEQDNGYDEQPDEEALIEVAEAEVYETADEIVRPAPSHRRAWVLLLLVLILGVLAIGVLIATRPLTPLPPTMKPPWMV